MMSVKSLISLFAILHFGSAVCCLNGGIEWREICYVFYPKEMTFDDAEKTCIENGSHLVSFHDAFVNSVVARNAPDYFGDDPYYWIGANFSTVANTWGWTDGSNFTFKDWKMSEPSMMPGLGCAAGQVVFGWWRAENCASLKPFVCMVYLPTDAPKTMDTSQKNISYC